LVRISDYYYLVRTYERTKKKDETDAMKGNYISSFQTIDVFSLPAFYNPDVVKYILK